MNYFLSPTELRSSSYGGFCVRLFFVHTSFQECLASMYIHGHVKQLDGDVFEFCFAGLWARNAIPSLVGSVHDPQPCGLSK